MLTCRNSSAAACSNLQSFRPERSIGHETRGPLVVIANYVFDSLPQDAFADPERRNP